MTYFNFEDNFNKTKNNEINKLNELNKYKTNNETNNYFKVMLKLLLQISKSCVRQYSDMNHVVLVLYYALPQTWLTMSTRRHQLATAV